MTTLVLVGDPVPGLRIHLNKDYQYPVINIVFGPYEWVVHYMCIA